ncbi:hypothetical protein GQ457_17G013100 [Hibiscus cannabinus]
MAWLINSVVPDIGENFMLYHTTIEIWTADRETYSNTDNIAELFGVENQIRNLRQCWQQIDLYEVPEWKCSDDSKVYEAFKNQKRVFQFLSDLSGDLDDVRIRILATKPFPLVLEAFSGVRREESHTDMMLPISKHADGSAFLTHVGFGSQSRKGQPWCDYCKKLGHLLDRCWKFHGKPADERSLPPPQSRDFHMVVDAPPSSVSTFSPDQL